MITTLTSLINEELDFSNICRVCCIEGKLMSIFKVHLFKKIMSIAEVNVSTYSVWCYLLLFCRDIQGKLVNFAFRCGKTMVFQTRFVRNAWLNCICLISSKRCARSLTLDSGVCCRTWFHQYEIIK